MKLLSLFLCLFLTHAQVCKSPSGASRVFQTVSVSGTERTYEMYVPEGVDYPASLVIGFHGIASSPSQIESKMRMQVRADEHKFIFVLPVAQNQNGGIFDPPAFNGAGCCKNDNNLRDVDFVKALKAQLVDDGCVEVGRVFSIGFSNGGFMTHRLACEDSSLVAAAAIHSGLYGDYNGVLANSPWSSCDTTEKVPMIGFMGTADIVVPYGGGPNPSPFSRSRWFSWEDTMAVWANQNQCGEAVTVRETQGSYDIMKTSYRNCDVESFVIQGLGHDWWSQATENAINFFLAHGL